MHASGCNLSATVVTWQVSDSPSKGGAHAPPGYGPEKGF